MAFTAEAIIKSIESRLGDNGSHVWKFYGLKSGTAWCCGEVCYTFNKTGNKAKIFGGKPIFYVPTAQGWLADNYKTIYDYRKGGDLSKVEKGDIIIFMWKRGSRDHIGFAYSDGSASQIKTIEGNTSGGKVAKRTRLKANIYAVYRPPYKSTSPEKKETQTKKETAKTPKYSAGKTYTIQVSDLNVRTGPGTGFSKKTKKQLTADGQKNSDAEGQLKKGTKVTCQGIKQNGSEIWMKIPSGWICAYNGKKYYAK